MKKITLIILIILAIIAISIGVYLVGPYFTSTVVDEPLPTASGSSVITTDNFISH